MTTNLFQLSNGDLKKVEDLTLDDFVSCAETSHDVGIDQSLVTKLKEVMENGSVTVDFSVGDNKTKVIGNVFQCLTFIRIKPAGENECESRENCSKISGENGVQIFYASASYFRPSKEGSLLTFIFPLCD